MTLSSPSPPNEMGQPTERECPEEAVARVPDGPGVVLDGEQIVRLVLRDEHWTADGCLTPAALPTSDLLEPEREGLSVNRLSHMTHEELDRIVGGYEKRDPRNKLCGCGVVSASGVRKLRADGLRVFCVVDDPRDGIDSHALVRLAGQARYSKGSVKRLRRRLIDLLTSCSAESLRSYMGRVMVVQ